MLPRAFPLTQNPHSIRIVTLFIDLRDRGAVSEDLGLQVRLEVPEGVRNAHAPAGDASNDAMFS